MLLSDVLFTILVGRGVMYDLDLILADKGVLSVDELLSVRGLPPGVDVFLGTLEPKPTGVGLMPLAPERMLLERRTLDPLRPPSSSLFNDMFEP